MTIDEIIKTFYDELDNSTNNNYSSRRQSHNKLNTYKIFEESNNIIFKCFAPGMTKEDIDITFDKKRLCVKSADESGDADFKTKFNNSISLYKSIDADSSYAQLNKGILTVTMPIDKKETKKRIMFR
jgi:HSP20 family molecular chaperone IbpA